MLYSVETGKSGYEKSLGMPMFDWLAKSPRDASLFSETMIGFHGAEPAAVAAAYDFSGLTTIVEVGGATGNLLTTILGSQPRTCGILFDLPHVVSDAPALIQARGLASPWASKAPKSPKEAAEMVRTDDNFASITAAVREGRTIQQHREGHPFHASHQRRPGSDNPCGDFLGPRASCDAQ